MAFTLYQADEMPQDGASATTKVEKLGDGVFKVWVDLSNDKVAPTILAKAAHEQRRAAGPAHASTARASRCCRPAGCRASGGRPWRR